MISGAGLGSDYGFGVDLASKAIRVMTKCAPAMVCCNQPVVTGINPERSLPGFGVPDRNVQTSASEGDYGFSFMRCSERGEEERLNAAGGQGAAGELGC